VGLPLPERLAVPLLAESCNLFGASLVAAASGDGNFTKIIDFIGAPYGTSRGKREQ
jgi:hypothetical protein